MNQSPSNSTRFSVSCSLDYIVNEPSEMLLNVHALKSPSQQPQRESFLINGNIQWEEIPSKPDEARRVRFQTGNCSGFNISYQATVTSDHTLINHQDILESPISSLDGNIIPYLFPSRYCQSDKLGETAHATFGGIPHAYDRVVAISDWIFNNVGYVAGSTNATTSAMDTFNERSGVCRDFAHLGIAFCRALSIPARYVTAYACNMQPQDFHACFEAFIGGRWLIFDPTRMAPLNGLVRIASGRDAADTSFATIFGNMTLSDMKVSCTSPDFLPFGPGDLANKAVGLNS